MHAVPSAQPRRAPSRLSRPRLQPKNSSPLWTERRSAPNRLINQRGSRWWCVRGYCRNLAIAPINSLFVESLFYRVWCNFCIESEEQWIFAWSFNEIICLVSLLCFLSLSFFFLSAFFFSIKVSAIPSIYSHRALR